MPHEKKYPVIKYQGSRIRHITERDCYQADFSANGHRDRKRFKTLADAKTWIDQKRVESVNLGRQAFSISDRDRIAITEARQSGKLGEVDLQDVIEYWLERHPTGEQKTIYEVVGAFLDAPGRRGGRAVKRRERTEDNHRKRLARFVDAFGERSPSEIETSDIEAWLDVNGWHGLNARNYLSSVRSMFRFAVLKGWALDDPTAKIELPESHSPEPEIMPVAHVDKYLAAVAAIRPELLPREAIAFFTGLRSAELERLDWRNVSIENKLLTVGPDVAKVAGQRRVVPLSGNLIKWLAPFARDKGPVSQGSARHIFKCRQDAATLAGVALPHNAARHAFASFHLAAYQNAALTAEALGHSDVRLLRTVYRNINTLDGKPITQGEGERFFNIVPVVEKVVQFPKRRAG